ncbi:MAG: flagellin [Epulopiscium sp.]|nr:flagellin [Candidatus Epulonipiscium sp.]
MRINHNIPALRTLHQMNRTNGKIDKTMQRLSSGLRINSAADDAAGLAIAQKMDTQVRGLKQANRNSMDGISLIQTAEGALNEVHAMLQRTRELAIQASNGTLTASDRKAITDEVAQLKEEINRISEHIEYNERKLLNGEIDRRAFSTNNDLGKVISMSDGVEPGDYSFTVTDPATKTTLQGGGVDGLFDTNGKITQTGIVNINGEQVEIKEDDDADTVFRKLSDLCDTMGIDMATVDNEDFANGEKINMLHREYGKKEITINGDEKLLEALGLKDVGVDGAKKSILGSDVAVTINKDTFPPGVTPSTKGSVVTFEGTNGFRLSVDSAKTKYKVDKANFDPESPGLDEVTLSLLKTGPLDLQIGANEGQMMQLRIQNMSTAALGLDDMNLNTSAKSQEAIGLVDAAIAQVSSARSKLGAYQNRLEHTVANLDVAAENMTSSMARIQDADMAAEMAEYTKDNILAQAGNAMLAQANQRPQQILQLLQ